jgi:hypothetical protein
MPRTETLYILACRTCGQRGEMRITENGQRDWAFAAVGFFGLAVNRHNPPNSVIRCGGCSSPHVAIERGPVAETSEHGPDRVG